MLVEALVAELAVEAFDVAVLHRLARIDQSMLDAVPLGPDNEGPAGELRTIVGAYDLRIATEARGLVQQANDEIPADAVVHHDVHALVSEVVGHRQALDATTARKRITDEVHAPDLVEYKQLGGWTASPNELDTAASRLDAWHGTNVRYRPTALGRLGCKDRRQSG